MNAVTTDEEHTLRHHSNRIAPVALALALSFGMAACDGSYDAGDGTEEVEGQVDDTTDTSDTGDTTGDSGY